MLNATHTKDGTNIGIKTKRYCRITLTTPFDVNAFKSTIWLMTMRLNIGHPMSIPKSSQPGAYDTFCESTPTILDL